MTPFRIGVQLHPEHTTIERLRDAWTRADELGVDSIWTWDHFFAQRGDRHGPRFEAWTLLTAMAVDTHQASIGLLVSCNSFRNPDLVADMARTVDHISGGRTVIGLGAGWDRPEHEEYGYTFEPICRRQRSLASGVERIRHRLGVMNPPPLGPLPILIGGGGERGTLKVVAAYAQMWHWFGPAREFQRKNAALDEWCRRLGRDPRGIERLVNIPPEDLERFEDYLGAGAQHLIVGVPHPYELAPLEWLIVGRSRMAGRAKTP